MWIGVQVGFMLKLCFSTPLPYGLSTVVALGWSLPHPRLNKFLDAVAVLLLE